MSEYNVPDDRKYTKEHEWLKMEGGLAVVGLTDYAQSQLGDITFVELPEAGSAVEAMGEMCVVESVKAASDVYSPVAGEVAEINGALEDDPALVNQDCYGEGWLVKLAKVDAAGLDDLLDAAAYESFIEQEG